ncbi:MAG: MFS transporter [Dehalococcoidia bacterium]|nr:MFS transporter [Dehalococcoidia bacterium]
MGISGALRKRFRSAVYFKISIFGAGLAMFWTALHALVLPEKINQIAPDASRNAYLGLITFAGLIVAMLAQPIAGAISDRSSMRWGHRRPFIFLGTVLGLMVLPGIGLSKSFLPLAIVYCGLQLSMNLAQAPFQAFIPDFVEKGRHGVAAGVKSLTETVAVVVVLRVVARLSDTHKDDLQAWLPNALWFVGAALFIAMLATLLLVQEKRPSPTVHPPLRTTLARAFTIDYRARREFIWFLFSRLLVLMALGTLQTFAFNYLRDFVRVSQPASATTGLLIAAGGGTLVSIYLAAWLSDQIGRKPVLLISCLLGMLSVVIALSAHGFTAIIIGSGILGLATGSFVGTNWALATDLVPKGEEARYLGLANMATAGAGALSKLIGPGIDYLNSHSPGLGYQAMLWTVGLYFLGGGLLTLMMKIRKETPDSGPEMRPST